MIGRRYARWTLWTCLLVLSRLASAESSATAQDVLFEDASILTPGQLEESNGRQGVPFQWQVNDTEQNAIVSDNVLNGTVVTGNNTISDHAFENMSGVATVIQNTGNHVVIQDSTQINVLINQ
ncbi:hypothetical protein RE428_43530 [Marinobacter nanhaiticus D15-8W]|uniref:Uncharacterized protein n=1 Tax=Marinobacter nanhaiticus D15-8W TaxID=626887 RepID=N6WXM0_9GAMM|nr:hypothetical protein [Marinobacter nanhaiticus]ENO15807.1 hypothetical protein J057_10661 [Marinobacter nanhaiticus D15-8W]BES73335.1 hypothetical protein RE428_43530 [Marinobacter nanhaiticus D15-8W]